MLFLCQQHLLLADLLGSLLSLKQMSSLFWKIHQNGTFLCHGSQDILRSWLWPFQCEGMKWSEMERPEKKMPLVMLSNVEIISAWTVLHCWFLSS